MIARIWHGWTTPGNADTYEALLRDEIVVGIENRRIPGFHGIGLLRRDAGTEVEFVTIMEFESLAAVREFAGDDYEAAVVPPSARAVLSRFDGRSQHYDRLVPRADRPPAPGAEVAAIRGLSLRWTAAVAAGDLVGLSDLMTDDVVVVHGNGRTLSGREAVLADMAASFRAFQVDQRVTFLDTAVEGPMAFDRSRVHTTVTARHGGNPQESDSHVFTILRKDPRRGWRVANSMGVVESAGS